MPRRGRHQKSPPAQMSSSYPLFAMPPSLERGKDSHGGLPDAGCDGHHTLYRDSSERIGLSDHVDRRPI